MSSTSVPTGTINQRKRAAAEYKDGDRKENSQKRSSFRQTSATRSINRRILKLFCAFISVTCVVYLLLPHLIQHLPFSKYNTPEDRAVQDTSALPSRGKHLSPSLPFPIYQKGVASTIVRKADLEKKNAVREAFQDSWSSYVRDAFGADEYHPIARKGTNFSGDGGVGYFIVDTIDVLLLMGDKEEYNRARDWVRTLEWSDKSGKFSVFEVRVLY